MMAESRDPDQPLCQGWLRYKQSISDERYEKRWFVLESSETLCHYRSQDKSPADSEYILYDRYSINLADQIIIILHDGQLKCYLKAESEVEYLKWAKALLETDAKLRWVPRKYRRMYFNLIIVYILYVTLSLNTEALPLIG